MLQVSLAFFVLGILALVLGATGIAGFTLAFGKMLLVVFLLCSLFSLIASVVIGKGPRTF